MRYATVEDQGHDVVLFKVFVDDVVVRARLRSLDPVVVRALAVSIDYDHSTLSAWPPSVRPLLPSGYSTPSRSI